MADLDALAMAVSHFRPVTPQSEGIVSEYAERYYQRHRMPRFFLSPTYLAAQPTVYTWGNINDCLVLLKRRTIIGNRVMYLVVPPISASGDIAGERELIEWFRARHVGTMLGPEDLELYGYRPEDAPPDPRWPEYAYDSQDFAEPSGRHHKNTRAALNLLDRLVAEGMVQVDDVSVPFAEPLEWLARTWHQQTGRHRGEVRLVRTFQEHAARGPLRRRALVLRDERGHPFAHSLTEEVCPGQVVIVSRLRDYTAALLPDPTLTVHALDCLHWSDVPALLTSGSAGTPGLTGHKAKLRPIGVVPLGRLQTERALTREEYDAAKPGGAPAQLTLEIPQ